MSTNLSQTLHPKIRQAIGRLVEKNICAVETVKLHLNELVEKMFDAQQLPDKTNRCFYPTNKDIRNHIYMSLFKRNKTNFDQEALEANINKWKEENPDDAFYFRPYKQHGNILTDEEVATPILFCHQTKWQRDLLNRYGNHITVLDAAYKATKYILPQFFLAVKTNAGYSAVGTFIVHSELCILVSEALSIFSKWNPDWTPKYFMADFSEAQVNAIEEIFPASSVYLCAYNREQSWLRWLRKCGNVPKGDRTHITALWRTVATSKTEEEFNDKLKLMDQDEIYCQYPLAGKHFTNEWLPNCHTWAETFHSKDFLSKLNTNNGIESQNRVFNHSFLKHSLDKSLSGMVRAIVEGYLPGLIENYTKYNASTCTSFSEDVPMFLQERPVDFIKHVMSRYQRAKSEYNANHVYEISEGIFSVKSLAIVYKVDLVNVFCFCNDFTTWRLPCKHMCAVFLYTDWSFDRLPVEYTESPYITVDSEYSAVVATDLTEPTTDPSPQSVRDEDAMETDSSDSPVDEICTETTPDDQDFDFRPVLMREKLNRFIEYTHLSDTTNPVMLEFDRFLDEWELKIKSTLAHKGGVVVVDTRIQTDVTLNAENSSRPRFVLKPIHNKCVDLPSDKKTKNVRKFVGRLSTVADKWCQETRNTTHPLKVDSVIEIDVGL